MARRGAPLPPVIFMGRAIRVAPVGGSWSRAVRFSKAGISAANRIWCDSKRREVPGSMLAVSRPTEATRRFKADDSAQKALAETEFLSAVSADGFDAIFYPGGHGPLWDLAEDGDSKSLIEAFAASDRPVGAVCHAPAVFKHTKGADGKPLVSGKTVTSFTNTEEEAVGLTNIVPFLVEDMLTANGGDYQKGDDWASFVVTDGKLVTGQNPASSEAAAHKLLNLL